MKPYNIAPINRKTMSVINTGSSKGLNLFTAPEFLTADYCLENKNYIIEQAGKLKKRGGTELVFEVAGQNPITMLEKYTNDIWIFGYSNIVSAYRVSTDTVTVIKNDFTTSDPFSGQRVGDYFFVCNGGDKIGRISQTLTYDSPQVQDFTVGRTLTGGTSGATGTIIEKTSTATFYDVGSSDNTLTLSTINTAYAGSDVSLMAGDIVSFKIYFWKSGVMTAGKLQVELWSSGATPTAQILILGEVDHSELNTSASQYTFTGLVDKTLPSAQNYFIVVRVTEAPSAGNFNIYRSAHSGSGSGDLCFYNGATWAVSIANRTMDYELTIVSSTGTLTLGNVDGVFSNAETITDILGASATTTSASSFTFTEISEAPRASVIYNFGNRLYAGGIQGSPSKIQWSNADDGVNPPYNDWTTVNDPPFSSDPSNLSFTNAGAFKSFASLGAQIVALFDDGKAGFRIDTIDVSGTGLSQYTITDFQSIDFGGERGAINTPKGVFYVNEAGIWQMLSGGNTNQPYSEQNSNISRILGQDLIDTIDFTDASIVFDEKRNLILVACKKDADFNNLIIWYNLETKNFGTISGWNVKRFFKLQSEIYYTDSIYTKVYKAFQGYSDNGQIIETSFLIEPRLGGLDDLFDLVVTKIKGFISEGSETTVSFDIYDKDGILYTNYKSYTLTAAGLLGEGEGFNDSGFGSIDTITTNNVETRAAKRTRIRNFTRLRMRITSSDIYPHELTWNELQYIIKGNNRRKNNLN